MNLRAISVVVNVVVKIPLILRDKTAELDAVEYTTQRTLKKS